MGSSSGLVVSCGSLKSSRIKDQRSNITDRALIQVTSGFMCSTSRGHAAENGGQLPLMRTRQPEMIGDLFYCIFVAFSPALVYCIFYPFLQCTQTAQIARMLRNTWCHFIRQWTVNLLHQVSLCVQMQRESRLLEIRFERKKSPKKPTDTACEDSCY